MSWSDNLPGNMGQGTPLADFGSNGSKDAAAIWDTSRPSALYKGTFVVTGSSNPSAGLGPFDAFSGAVSNDQFYGGNFGQSFDTGSSW